MKGLDIENMLHPGYISHPNHKPQRSSILFQQQNPVSCMNCTSKWRTADIIHQYDSMIIAAQKVGMLCLQWFFTFI
jgi:hypothetical protein